MSLARGILENHNFFDDFYKTFFESSAKIPEFFKDTDLSRQKKVVKDGILVMIMFAEGSPIGLEKLAEIAEIHSKKNRNIDPKLYPLWIETLIETLRKNDPEFSDELEQSWRKIIAKGIDFFVEKYQ